MTELIDGFALRSLYGCQQCRDFRVEEEALHLAQDVPRRRSEGPRIVCDYEEIFRLVEGLFICFALHYLPIPSIYWHLHKIHVLSSFPYLIEPPQPFLRFSLDAPHLHPSSLITSTTLVLTNASTVTFKNESDGKDIELDVRGTWYNRSVSVTFGEKPVAHISRSLFDVREIFADKDTVSFLLSFNFLFLFYRKEGVGLGYFW